MDVMSSGFTFVERDESGKIVNADFKPFASLQECCAAAEEALRANPAMPLGCTQVILCRYNRHHCIPKMQPVLKTFEITNAQKRPLSQITET